jgi:hypothetical protein
VFDTHAITVADGGEVEFFIPLEQFFFVD